MEDKAIIELYFQRDEAAIRETDRAHGAVCRRVALNILGIREEAEECVSDAYLAAWERIPPLVPRSLRAFLCRVTRDLSINRWRRNRAKKRYDGMETLLSELDDCVPAPEIVERTVEAAELAELISGWLDAQSPDDRALFLRRYWYGDAVHVLAEECGCTANRMAQRFFKLRKSLRAALEAEGVFIE